MKEVIMSIEIEERIHNEEKLEKPKKFNIWCLDNDRTAFDEVVAILVNAFNMSRGVAAELTRKVDNEGRAKVNPKPMSKGIAQAQLNKVNSIKRTLAERIPFRSKEIMMLKFIIKED